MSWQSYVDDNLVSTGRVAKASIFGLDGSLWASSADFKIGGEEAKKLIAAFEDPSGVLVNVLTRMRQGATGVTCVKTKQAVLVGYYSESMQAGDCNTVVQNLGEYLASTGY
ncbi:hypothetical protein BGZ68_002884 [Mortierella alpina]|nr:hypothetical protein BGZ68_002884 [Mortierella alpina]